MKLAKHSNNLLTNTDNETQNFGIGDASVVIEILRNRLYKHKVRTLVQEYISNARDANREVDSKRDIEIIAPSHFDPTFKVRDFGQGISPERMSTIFIKYGASTKRDSNNQTGGFGIGAKSAWSYTDSFTIITHIDGIKRTYLAHTGLNNNGRLDMLNESTTNEDNGTEIQIGVNPDDITQFNNSINRAIHFWSENVELKGLTTTKQDLGRGIFIDNDKSIEILNNVDISNYGFNYYSDSLVLAIDGILYQVDNSKFNKADLKHKAVLHIPVGKIEVSASREEIAICKANEDYLKKLVEKYNIEIEKYQHNKLKAATKIQDKIKVINELSEYFNINIKENGYTFHSNTMVHDDFKEVSLIHYSMNRGRLDKTHICDNTKPYSRRTSVIDTTNLYFFDNSESIVKRNKRIRKFLETNNNIKVLELKDSDKTLYNKFKKELEFQDLLSLELPIEDKQLNMSPKIKRANTEFCIHGINSHWGVNRIHTSLAKNTEVWYYISIKDSRFCNKRQLRELPINVCGLSDSTIKRVKDNKNFISLDSYLKEIKPTQDQLKVVKYKVSINNDDFNKIDLDTIENKKIKTLGLEYNEHSTRQIASLLFEKFKQHKEIVGFVKRDKEVNGLLKQCKLLDSLNYRPDKKEVSIYINAKLNKGA